MLSAVTLDKIGQISSPGNVSSPKSSTVAAAWCLLILEMGTWMFSLNLSLCHVPSLVKKKGVEACSCLPGYCKGRRKQPPTCSEPCAHSAILMCQGQLLSHQGWGQGEPTAGTVGRKEGNTLYFITAIPISSVERVDVCVHGACHPSCHSLATFGMSRAVPWQCLLVLLHL